MVQIDCISHEKNNIICLSLKLKFLNSLKSSLYHATLFQWQVNDKFFCTHRAVSSIGRLDEERFILSFCDCVLYKERVEVNFLPVQSCSVRI